MVVAVCPEDSGSESRLLGAMLKGARVVLLDEATAFLDPESERAIGEALVDLRRGATVVTVAHRLGSIIDYDQIAYIDQGRVRGCFRLRARGICRANAGLRSLDRKSVV